jgi:DNA-binding XRE family transcriptional regulator
VLVVRLTVGAARAQLKLTQREMARKLGVSDTTYRDREKNPDHLSIGEAKKIAELVGCTLDDLQFYEEETLS